MKMKELTKKEKGILGFIIILVMIFTTILIITPPDYEYYECPDDKSDIEVSTSYSKFLSVNQNIKSIQEANGETYLFLDLSPEIIAPSGEIYNAARCGRNVFITINDIFPEVNFTISGGLYDGEYIVDGVLYKDKYLRVKCKSIDDAKSLAGRLGLHINE